MSIEPQGRPQSGVCCGRWNGTGIRKYRMGGATGARQSTICRELFAVDRLDVGVCYTNTRVFVSRGEPMAKSTRPPSPPSVAMALRLPPDVKKWLEAQSQKSFTSQNAEVVRSCRERMDAERERQRERA